MYVGIKLKEVVSTLTAYDFFQDHIKSKKHVTSMNLKKDRYPEVMKKMNDIQPKYADERDKPNNGDRLAYRFLEFITYL